MYSIMTEKQKATIGKRLPKMEGEKWKVKNRGKFRYIFKWQ